MSKAINAFNAAFESDYESLVEIPAPREFHTDNETLLESMRKYPDEYEIVDVDGTFVVLWSDQQFDANPPTTYASRQVALLRQINMHLARAGKGNVPSAELIQRAQERVEDRVRAAAALAAKLAEKKGQ